MKGFVKDPNAILDYSFNWAPWLDGDTITASTWILESPLIAVSASEVFDNTTTGLFISGGTHGNDYLVTNRITTTGGLTDDRSFELRVRNK
jgi:hypothetical protein